MVTERIAWTTIVVINAAIFGLYLHRLGYARKWLAILAALFLGPIIWAWWALIRYGERRGRKRASRAV